MTLCRLVIFLGQWMLSGLMPVTSKAYIYDESDEMSIRAFFLDENVCSKPMRFPAVRYFCDTTSVLALWRQIIDGSGNRQPRGTFHIIVLHQCRLDIMSVHISYSACDTALLLTHFTALFLSAYRNRQEVIGSVLHCRLHALGFHLAVK